MEDLLGVTFIEQQAANVAASAGLPEDQTKFVFCLLIAYPLAFLFSKLPTNPTLKHVINMFIGLYFGWLYMKWQILHSFISSAVVYLLAKFLPRDQGHKIAFAWVMAYMSISHIYRMYTDYMGWTMDFTGPQMVLTIKLITFAFDYRDGALNEKDMKPYQKIIHLKELPSPLEFFGYVYFFCGFLAGPAVNTREYLSFIDGSLFNDAPNKKMPSSVLPALWKFGQTLLILVGVFLQMQYPLVYCRTEEFVSNPLIYKMGYIWLAAVLQRFPYYFAWYFSEGSCIMAGIGYSGMVNGKPTWNRATNVKLVALETGQSFKDVTEAWNIRTDKWLKHYIYERVEKNAVALTFLMSAVWHGFYPGYYFSFFTAGFIVQFARTLRRNFRPRFMQDDEKTPKPSKKLYDLACLIATSWTLNYCMTPFILLGGDYSWRAWSSVYFIGHILVGVVYGAALVVGPPRKKKTEEKKAQ